ncbi:MAG TPA: ATP-binding protein [Abditibacteriaceae bacterium]|jgi:two-component system sensor histidine kinase CpxA
MRSLFFKIFLCFWLSHTLAIMLVYAIMSAREAQRSEAQGPETPRRARMSVLPSRTITLHARNAAAIYERGTAEPGTAELGTARPITTGQVPNQAALESYFKDIESKEGIGAALFDASNKQISTREMPSEAATVAARAASSGEVEFTSARGGLLAASRVRTPSGSSYVLVAEMPRTPGSPRRGSPPAMDRQPPREGLLVLLEGGRLGRRETYTLARFLTVFVAAGIVAYGLAIYLTAPTVKLRQATRQLASGDLSTRVGAKMGRRRDELADLGRDFDGMAERIQALMLTERRLLGDISHELRSPLARLQVALDLAFQTADEETRGFLQRIERESGRLNNLIGQLLILTRLETAGTDAPRKPVDLAQLVNEVASDADFEARGANRAVRVVSAEACRTQGNAELLRSAIENVVRNAVRYTREGTTVEITLSCTLSCESRKSSAHNDKVQQSVITVRDHGPGVPPEALQHLFRPFYRVADARDRQSGGVGLGLSITARAVRFHHGEVSARNIPEGGLCVEIRLPLANEI